MLELIQLILGLLGCGTLITALVIGLLDSEKTTRIKHDWLRKTNQENSSEICVFGNVIGHRR